MVAHVYNPSPGETERRAHGQSLLVDSLADRGAKSPVKDRVPKEKHWNMRQIFRSSCNCVDPQLSCVLPHQWEARTEAGGRAVRGEWELKVAVLFRLGLGICQYHGDVSGL